MVALKRLLTDVDEVLCDFQSPAFDVMEKVTGRRYRPEDFDVWDMFTVLTPEEKTACFEVFEKPGFCSGLKPFPAALEAIPEIRKRRHVFAVTSPQHSRHWVFERTEWLCDLFGFERREIIFTSTKHVVNGDDMLDDHPGHVSDWAHEHPNGNAMLWHIPNTRNLGQDERRVRSWPEVLARLG